MTKDEEDAVIRQKKLDAAQQDDEFGGGTDAGAGQGAANPKGGQDITRETGTGGQGAQGAGGPAGFGTGTAKT